MRINSDGLKEFLQCPVILNKFSGHFLETPIYNRWHLITKLVLLDYIGQLIEKRARPTINMTVAINNSFAPGELSSFELSKNIINLHTSINRFIDTQINNKAAFVAINYMVSVTSYKTTFIDIVPMLMIRDNKVIPIYFDFEHNSNWQDIKIRATIAALSEQLNTDIDEYMILQTNTLAGISEPKTYKIDSHKAYLNLTNILKYIDSKEQMPNLSYCNFCKFKLECKI